MRLGGGSQADPPFCMGARGAAPPPAPSLGTGASSAERRAAEQRKPGQELAREKRADIAHACLCLGHLIDVAGAWQASLAAAANSSSRAVLALRSDRPPRTMAMATQAPAGGGAMMAMAQPAGAMMMPTMPTGAGGGGGGGGPAGPAYQGDASLGLFAADEHGLAEDEVAIGIDLGGEWVRAAVWDADQKRAVPLDLDGFGGPLRLTRILPPHPKPHPHPIPHPHPNPSPDQAGRCERWWPSRGPRRPWWARLRSARRRRSTRCSVRVRVRVRLLGKG